MCDLAHGCTEKPEYNVIHKALGARPEYAVLACEGCARKVGSLSPEGPVIGLPGMDGKFYKIEPIR